MHTRTDICNTPQTETHTFAKPNARIQQHANTHNHVQHDATTGTTYTAMQPLTNIYSNYAPTHTIIQQYTSHAQHKQRLYTSLHAYVRICNNPQQHTNYTNTHRNIQTDARTYKQLQTMQHTHANKPCKHLQPSTKQENCAPHTQTKLYKTHTNKHMHELTHTNDHMQHAHTHTLCNHMTTNKQP